MLSFPSQNWEKAIVARGGKAPRNSGPGRLASRITPRIFLSDYYTAHDTEKLAQHGITHIISVIEPRPLLPEVIPMERQLHVAIADTSEANILEHLDRTTAFIQDALAENGENKVLVHCMQGVSRSATVVCAYLVATTPMTAPETIDHVRSIRGIVCPNLGFRKQLEQYEVKYVKLKPTPSPVSSPSIKLGGGIAARIQRLRSGS